MSDVSIRCARLTRREIAAVARMHATEVPEGFLATLGEPVLRLLYEHAATSELSRIFVAEDERGVPVGYICGTLDTGALLKEFLRRRWHTALPVIIPRLLSAKRIFRILETLRYSGTSEPGLPSAEIMNFVVVPAWRGHGVATVLFDHLMRWFAAAGRTEIKIVTGEHQRRARGFYEKSGSVPRGRTSIHRGTAARVYVYRSEGHDHAL
ncbi:GNAT family N-acetyltransferase [Actinoplanes sp. NPDC051851]|uniref:GNAT family N-acetyltransferase n=1 Tax=Actinoplanes sp. NPDC051851 TaxID=3154753 RepID=UPI003445A782